MRLINPREVDFIDHARQPERYGCLACGMYAVTGDQRFLDHMSDVQPWRMYAQASLFGYTVLGVWNTLERQIISGDVWDLLIAGLDDSGAFLYLITIESPTYPGLHHTVGVAAHLQHGKVTFTVSDSQRETLVQGDKTWFFSSSYCKALVIQQVIGSNKILHDLPYEPPLVLQARDLERNNIPAEAFGNTESLEEFVQSLADEQSRMAGN
jgi:hypothetical protein